MGYEIAAFSSSDQPPTVQDPVHPWLLHQSRYDQRYWIPNSLQYQRDPDQTSSQGYPLVDPLRSRHDVDESSLVSADDDVSVSDSTHDSLSSESSSQTSWTSTTESVNEPVENFLDEYTKEQLCQPSAFIAHADEVQEQALTGLRVSSGTESGNECTPCPLGYVYQTVKRASRHLPPTCVDLSQQRRRDGAIIQAADTCSGTNVQHRGSRRSTQSIRGTHPPTLTRDTESTAHFVTLLIIFARRLITSIWPASDRPPMMTDGFNGAGVLPLETFIRETLRRSKTSFSTLQVALYYLILLKSRMPHHTQIVGNGDSPERAQCRAMQCGRRMFLSALMLASKYLQDRNYSARAWSKISGLRSNEINENEREYLAQIKYELHVPKEMFENWSKIVLVLSHLTNRPPYHQAESFDGGFGPPEVDSHTSLAAMVSQVDLDEELNVDQVAFTDPWWTGVLGKLEPSILKKAPLVDFFLRTYLPRSMQHVIESFPHLSKQVNKPMDCLARSDDLNFGETLSAYSTPQSTKIHSSQTPQTPVQMSPARTLSLPSRPQLGNLPTPQTTPRMPDQYTREKGCPRLSRRCAATVDAMRSLRKQCFKNANLERCPPPQPQNNMLSPMKFYMPPAVTLQELPPMVMSLMSSPASVSSESTAATVFTSRSRSSSISSSSSWAPSMPRLGHSTACELGSSPLSRVSSLSDRASNLILDTCQNSTLNISGDSSQHSIAFQESVCKSFINDFVSIDSGSVLTNDGLVGECTTYLDATRGFSEAPGLHQANNPPTSSEVAAIHGLLSLSTQLETPSQSVTPTPQRLSEYDNASSPQAIKRLRDHKRKLSKTEPILQDEVRDILLSASYHNVVVEDSLKPYGGTIYRQTQLPTLLRKDSRRAVSTPMNHKRLCSLQHSSSTPSASPLSAGRDRSILLCP